MESDKIWRFHWQPDLDRSLVQVIIPTSALPTFTIIHVAISLAAIASGFIVLFGMIAGVGGSMAGPPSSWRPRWRRA